MRKSSSGKGALASIVLIAMIAAAGCSEGSGGGGSFTPPGSTGGGGSSGGGSSGGGGGTTNPTWTSGVYQNASTYKNRCQVVRTGVDIEGNPYPDMAGSTTYENFWLRSWTHETYLWNNEVVDRNPANYNDRLQYFDLLRTTAVTASGKPKDEFHFTESTADYLARRNSAPLAGYGASFIAYSTVPPRDFRIQYTEPGSPAATEVAGLANFTRGARILEVDGIDLVNANSQSAVDALNDGLFPATPGEMHSFVVQDVGAASRTVFLTSADIAQKPVNRTAIINTPTGDVGYALINTFSPFSSEQDIALAMTSFSNAGVSDVVLDLRYNGGGLLAVAAQLGYMIAGDTQTNGKTFEALRFNADAGSLNPVTGQANIPTPFYDTGLGFSLASGTPLDSVDLSRVFILTTDETCSASEAVINGLRGIDVEVIILGSTTCGKPYGFYPEDNCGETYYTIQFQGVNDKAFGDYADGFIPMDSAASFGVRVPGCVVNDDYTHELGDTAEGMLATALYYRTNGVCPPAPLVSVAPTISARAAPVVDGIAVQAKPEQSIMRNNRDMQMPN